MQTWIILLIGLLWTVWTLYGQLLLNKIVWVKNINSSALQSNGDIKVDGDTIQIKFFWSIKTFSFRQITQIKACTQTDWGLEEYDRVDILFENGNKICFSGLPQKHQIIVQAVLSSVSIEDEGLRWGFLPYSGDNMHKEIVFERINNSR